MTQPGKVCVVVDDEIEIHLTDDQLKYMNERKRLGRRSCDPNVTIMGSDECGALQEQVEDCGDLDHSTNVPTIVVASPADSEGVQKDGAQSVGENHSDESKSLEDEQPSGDLTVHQGSEACGRVPGGFPGGKLSTEESPEDKRFLTVPALPEDIYGESGKGDLLKDISHSRTAYPDNPYGGEQNDENAPPPSDTPDAVSSPVFLPGAKNLLDEKLKTPDVDHLSSKMSRAALSAQRKQLFQKSFQGCNYLDVGKLRSPNTKQVQSVLKTYINTVSPGKQQNGKEPSAPTPVEIIDHLQQRPVQGQHQQPSRWAQSGTPPRSGLGRSPCSVVHQSARVFGRPLAAPELLSSPAPLITIHHRPSPSALKRNPDDLQLRINESIYETFEAKISARK